MPNRTFLRWSGFTLEAGGALTLLVNAALSPFMPAQAEASSIFLWRQGASALAAALLLFGSVGLYLQQADRAGRFGAVAFTLAFLGSALLLAWEWIDVFVLRSLALRAPEALRMLDTGKGMSLYDLGALIPLVAFTLGWIALSVSTARTRAGSRVAASLVIGGFFAIPMLSAALPGTWGAVLGNAILGSGFVWLGDDVRRV
jgi:hypothetical protein